MFPEVTRLLTSHTGNTTNSEDILSSACYTVRNLMASQPQAARQHFSSSMVNNVINLCRSRCGALAHRPAPPHTQCRAGSPVGGGCRQRFQKPGGLGAKQLAARSQGCTEGPGACTSWPGAPRGPPEAESSWPSCVGATFLSTGSLLQDEGQGTRMGAHSTAGAPRSLPGWRGWGSCPLCREPGPGVSLGLPHISKTWR